MTKTGNLTIADEDVKQTRWTSALSANPHQQKRFNTKSRGKYSQSRQMQTIGATMRHSLLEMLQKASQGSAHFVRCLRSNLKSTPFTFDRDLIRYQLRALGILDSVRARQLGYSRRLKFAEFLRRYKFLAFDFEESVEETKDNCRLLLIRLKMEGWALGNSKVFLKYYNEEFLSRLYENQVHKVVKIQALMRAFLARKKTNSKFPRLAELRNQGADGIPPEKELNVLKKSLAEAGKKSKAPPVNPGRHSTGAVDLRYYDDSRRYSSTSTAASTPEPNLGYTPVYSSRAYGSGVYKGYAGSSSINYQRGPAPAKPSRRSLSPPEHDDAQFERPASPRDIAKAFEEKARKNSEVGIGGRNKPPTPSSTGYLLKTPVSPGDYQRSRNLNSDKGSAESLRSKGSKSPDIINPLEEFTNYANSMMANNDHDEPGPFNFQGMLRKTSNSSIKATSPETVYNSKPSVQDSNSNLSGKGSSYGDKKGGSSSPMKHCSSNPYPLPGMTSGSARNNNKEEKPSTSYQSQVRLNKKSPPLPRPRSRKSSRDSLDIENESPVSVSIAPGLIIEGFAEDL